MKVKTNRLLEAINQAGLEAHPYTGRFMDRTCVGIKLDSKAPINKITNHLSKIIVEKDDLNLEELSMMDVLNERVDNMESYFVMYFPDHEYEPDKVKEENIEDVEEVTDYNV